MWSIRWWKLLDVTQIDLPPGQIQQIVFTSWVMHAMLCCYAWPWTKRTGSGGLPWVTFSDENKFLIVKHQTSYPYTTVITQFPPPSAEEISRTWYSTKHERKPGCFQGRLKFRCLTAGFLTRKHQELHLDHWFSVVVDDIMPSQPNQLKDRKHQDIAAVDRVSFESFHELP